MSKQDASERNAVEGKFGEYKRKYGLGLIRARLQNTSETVVAIQFLILNLEGKHRVLFYPFFKIQFEVLEEQILLSICGNKSKQAILSATEQIGCYYK